MVRLNGLGVIEHFAGVQNAGGIERFAEFAHDAHLGVTGEFRQEGFLGDADAVFAGDGAAEANGFVENFVEGQFDAVHFFLVAFVGKEGRMQIAVAHVAESANTEIVLFGDLFDEANHVGEFAAWDSGVFENGGGGDAGQRGEGAASGAGELVSFGVVLGHANFARALFAANFFHLRGFLSDDGGMAVGLHEEKRFAIERQADLRVIFDTMNGGAVEELQSAGNDLRGDDGGDGFGGVVHLREGRNHRFLGGGFRNEPQEDFGDDAECAFGADEEIAQGITSHVFDAFVAGPKDFAVGQDHFQAHDVIACDAVFQTAQAAGIFGDVAADGGDFHGAGIGRIEKSGGGGGIGNFEGGDAGFDEDGEIGAVEFEDLVHPHRAKNDRVGHRQAAAAEAGPGPARDDGELFGSGDFEDGGDFGGGLDEENAAGKLLEGGGAVEGIGN